MRTLVMVMVLGAVVMGGVGCAARQKLYPAGPLGISSPAAGTSTCVERLLGRSRMTGYIEQTVDKEMGFFRVSAKNSFAQFEEKKRAPKVPKGKLLAVVAFYNVQCTGPESATIIPMNASGSLDDRYLMDKNQKDELERYAAAIGVPLNTIQDSDEPPPAPAPVPVPAGQTCIASELPEWQGASAAEKKALLDRCRAPAAPAAAP
jgi:hypothetical protein